MITFKQYLQESKKTDILNLQPNTKLSVFHGTTLKSLWHFITKGIDSTKVHYRQYQHGQAGLFVAPDEKTTHQFGNYVMKFKVLGKNLYSPDDINGTGVIKDISMKKWLEEKYPNSFRPDVTLSLLDPGPEPQAIFIGTVSPRAIEKIYHFPYGTVSSKTTKTYSREEFIKFIRENIEVNLKSGANISYDAADDIPLFEPQERPTYKDFIKRLSIYSSMSEKEIEIIVFEYAKNNPEELKEFLGNFMEDSVIKYLLPLIIKQL